MKRYKIWNIAFLTLSLAVMAGAALTVYVVDPLQFFRRASVPVFLKEQRYQNPGLARNYDYDTVIIGTSVTENFVPSYIDSKLGGKTLKLSMSGGMSKEQNLILNLALQTGKVKKVIWGIDWSSIRGDKDEVQTKDGPFPYYLYDDGILNKLQYLLSSTMLSQSVDLVLRDKGYKKLQSQELEYLNNWHSIVAYGEQYVKADLEYKRRNLKINEKEFAWTTMQESLEQNILPVLKNHPDVTFYVFFPPYSKWYFVPFYEKDPQTVENWLKAKRYLLDSVTSFPNVKVYDFQDAWHIVSDPSRYKDTMHYSQDTCHYIVDSIAQDKHRLTAANVETRQQNIWRALKR